jgi:hypothetical protein
MIGLVAIAMTLPAETILLRAVSQTSKQAAAAWAESLSSDGLLAASEEISSLPFAYRRAVLSRLAPAARASVWRKHVQGYIDDHSNLDESTLALLYNAKSLISAESLSSAGGEDRAQMAILAEQLSVILGRSEAEYLFYRIGPKDVTMASALPLGDKLGEFIRSRFVVEARIEDCDCHMGFGCDAPSHCSDTTSMGCTKHDDWPACGWFWNQECNGLCMSGLPDLN